MSLIIKLTDPKDNKVYYLEWSTMWDTPLTKGASLDYFKRYYKREYGRHGMKTLEDRLSRVEKYGSSSSLDSLDSIIKNNRAGDNETRLDLEGLLNKYCRNV